MVNRNGNGSANGVRQDAAIIDEHALLWDGLSPAATEKLAQPLDPGLVSQRKGRGNRSFDYIEGHTAIGQANAIFGFGGWGYDLVGDVALREIENVDAKTGEVKRIHAYAATVRVNVPGAPSRTDVGFHAVAEESVEGHETACKGAVTDALKRALRSFGDQFGNGLYGDPAPGAGQAQPTAKVPPRPARGTSSANGKSGGAGKRPIRQAQGRRDAGSIQKLRARLIELGAAQGFDEDGVRAAVRKQTGRDLGDLAAPELTLLIVRATAKVREIQEAQAA